jgi:hypothetical protein
VAATLPMCDFFTSYLKCFNFFGSSKKKNIIFQYDSELRPPPDEATTDEHAAAVTNQPPADLSDESMTDSEDSHGLVSYAIFKPRM